LSSLLLERCSAHDFVNGFVIQWNAEFLESDVADHATREAKICRLYVRSEKRDHVIPDLLDGGIAITIPSTEVNNIRKLKLIDWKFTAEVNAMVLVRPFRKRAALDSAILSLLFSRRNRFKVLDWNFKISRATLPSWIVHKSSFLFIHCRILL
jgi:hypothetical protein